LTYSLHRGAELDLADAARFYRREGGRAVAARFLDEFERIAELLVEHPGIGTPTDDERRWFPLTGYPCSVIYRPLDPGVRILVVRHQNRDPVHGEQRR
jgi:plasmid stabilization system protein ParE